MSKEIVASGKSQRYRCRDDHEWEGGVWVAQNQVHFSQHLPIQHSTSHKQHHQIDLQIQSTPHTRRVLIRTVKQPVLEHLEGKNQNSTKSFCVCARVRPPARPRACMWETIVGLLVVSLSLFALFLLLPPSPLSPSFCLSLFLRFCAWVEAANSLRIALQLCLCVSEREGRQNPIYIH